MALEEQERGGGEQADSSSVHRKRMVETGRCESNVIWENKQQLCYVPKIKHGQGIYIREVPMSMSAVYMLICSCLPTSKHLPSDAPICSFFNAHLINSFHKIIADFFGHGAVLLVRRVFCDKFSNPLGTGP